MNSIDDVFTAIVKDCDTAVKAHYTKPFLPELSCNPYIEALPPDTKETGSISILFSLCLILDFPPLTAHPGSASGV